MLQVPWALVRRHDSYSLQPPIGVRVLRHATELIFALRLARVVDSAQTAIEQAWQFILPLHDNKYQRVSLSALDLPAFAILRQEVLLQYCFPPWIYVRGHADR
jgi:hypothetical protein